MSINLNSMTITSHPRSMLTSPMTSCPQVLILKWLRKLQSQTIVLLVLMVLVTPVMVKNVTLILKHVAPPLVLTPGLVILVTHVVEVTTFSVLVMDVVRSLDSLSTKWINSVLCFWLTRKSRIPSLKIQLLLTPRLLSVQSCQVQIHIDIWPKKRQLQLRTLSSLVKTMLLTIVHTIIHFRRISLPRDQLQDKIQVSRTKNLQLCWLQNSLVTRQVSQLVQCSTSMLMLLSTVKHASSILLSLNSMENAVAKTLLSVVIRRVTLITHSRLILFLVTVAQIVTKRKWFDSTDPTMVRSTQPIASIFTVMVKRRVLFKIWMVVCSVPLVHTWPNLNSNGMVKHEVVSLTPVHVTVLVITESQHQCKLVWMVQESHLRMSIHMLVLSVILAVNIKPIWKIPTCGSVQPVPVWNTTILFMKWWMKIISIDVLLHWLLEKMMADISILSTVQVIIHVVSVMPAV